MLKYISLILSSLTFIMFASPSVYADETYNVLKVTDGDTLVININLNNKYDKKPFKESCRLIGVSTTELGKFKTRIPESGALDATHFLKGLLTAEGNQVSFSYDPTTEKVDRSKRQLIYAYLLNGKCINELILSSGYGIVYLKYDYDPVMRKKLINCTHEAYKNKAGLWSDKVIKAYWLPELNKYDVDLTTYKKNK